MRSQPGLSEVLGDKSYVRERILPAITDEDYLSFVDLRNLVELFARSTTGDVLDYGCGGSPYRCFFSGCDSYIRADVTDGSGIDITLGSAGETHEPDNHYDAVLSTQVLEHVRYPRTYLEESFRILKPGGSILVSTHGLFQEHGCPYDFHRWTARGLVSEMEARGFVVTKSYKLTSEIRGVIQLSHHLVRHLKFKDRLMLHYLFAVVRRLYCWTAIPCLNMFGAYFENQGIVSGNDDGSSVYVGVAVCARKPA